MKVRLTASIGSERTSQLILGSFPPSSPSSSFSSSNPPSLLLPFHRNLPRHLCSLPPSLRFSHRSPQQLHRPRSERQPETRQVNPLFFLRATRLAGGQAGRKELFGHDWKGQVDGEDSNVDGEGGEGGEESCYADGFEGEYFFASSLLSLSLLIGKRQKLTL